MIWLGSKRGYLSDWVTQRWVRFTGRRVSLASEPWLAGPIAPNAERRARLAERAGFLVFSGPVAQLEAFADEMPTPDNIAETFRDLDFHDYTFVDMRALPSQVPGESVRSIVEIQLLQYSQRKLRSIRFSGCTNLGVAMDFDVLTHNLPSNTSSVDAHANLNRMQDLMQSQKRDWGVEYSADVVSPLAKKLEAMDDLISFRLQFCGGAVDVIARDYRVETVDQR